jgi:CDGSH-type Zn-finger protein
MPPITITVRTNGPLLITGEDAEHLRLVDQDGNEISIAGKKTVKLCRCGASTQKPFCDGTHSRIGFQGAEAARADFDAQQGQPQSTQPQSTQTQGAPQQAAPEAPHTAS